MGEGLFAKSPSPKTPIQKTLYVLGLILDFCFTFYGELNMGFLNTYYTDIVKIATQQKGRRIDLSAFCLDKAIIPDAS